MCNYITWRKKREGFFMFMACPKRKDGNIVVRLIVSYRKEGKPKSKIVKTIGQSKDPKAVERYKKIAKELIEKEKKGLVSIEGAIRNKITVNLSDVDNEERRNNGFNDILGFTYQQLGFNDLIQAGRDPKKLNAILKNLVLMRVFDPSSKLKSSYLLEEHFGKNITLKQILNLMDHISDQEENIRDRISQVILNGEKSLDIVLFDVTTLAFESVVPTDLLDFGYSKDGKPGEVQVVLAVLSNQKGLPISYELFAGNTSEFETFESMIKGVSRKYNLRKIRVIADRGLFSNNNLEALEGLNSEGIKAEYIVSCPLKKLPKSLKDSILNKSNYKDDGTEGSKILYHEVEYNNRRIIISYSEKRGRHDIKKRERAVEKLKELEKDGKIKSSKLIKGGGKNKYIQKVRGDTKIDWKKVEQDALWDGLYGVCTNLKSESVHAICEARYNLWRIEELFRINKHNLKMRPIYHRKTQRIRSHIAICFLAYVVLRSTEITLKEAGVNISSQELIETLKDVETNIIRNRVKVPSKAYGLPRKLSAKAKKIYKLFGKEFPERAYEIT